MKPDLRNATTPSSWVVLQIMLVLLAVLLPMAIPPARGAMLLLPIDRAAALALPSAALDGDARLIGRGPVAGSMVVSGERSRLAPRMLAMGVLTLAAPAAGCVATDAGTGA